MTGFKLENKSTCSGFPQCLDWVQHQMKNVQGRRKLCGSGELGEIHADGANEMHFEFVSNRKSQHDGFEYYITCTDPGFDGNAVRSGVVTDATPKQRMEAANCTSPRGRQYVSSQYNPLVSIQTTYWQVIAQVCGSINFPEPNYLPYCPLSHVVRCLLPSLTGASEFHWQIPLVYIHVQPRQF